MHTEDSSSLTLAHCTRPTAAVAISSTSRGDLYVDILRRDVYEEKYLRRLSRTTVRPCSNTDSLTLLSSDASERLAHMKYNTLCDSDT